MTKAPLALIANVRLGQKCQTETNGLAYSAQQSVTKKKKKVLKTF